MQELKEREKLKERIREGTCVLVQYGRESCMPCKGIRRRLDLWLKEEPRAEGIYVSLDRFPELGAEEGIFTVPALLLYMEGKLTQRACGCFSVNTVLSCAERYLKLLES